MVRNTGKALSRFIDTLDLSRTYRKCGGGLRNYGK